MMTKRSFTRRRAAALAAAVTVIAVAQLLVVTAIEPASTEMREVESRVLSARARHAAESAVRVVIARIESGQDLPAEGETIELPSAVATFLRVPPSGVGEIVVEARAGDARRRLSVIVQ